MSGFLDAAAGLPLHPAARETLLAALDDGWADPTKLYAAGRRARQLLDGAREAVATQLGARPDEVLFTPSGTAAVQLGLLGTRTARRRVGSAVVHSAVEHSSLLHAAGEQVTSVPVDRTGRVEVPAFAAALRPDTAVACLLSASHEVGTVQPVEEVAEHCQAVGVPLLVDAAQTVGRMPVPTGWSLLTASAHKWGGPRGVGVLAVRTGTRWRSPLPGGDREPAMALPSVLAAAVGLQAVAAESATEGPRLRALVDRMRAQVAATVPDVTVVGDPHDRLPHLLALSFPYADGEVLQRALDREGFAVSSGSSCGTALEPSHVLEAMGLLTSAHVRVSLHRGTTEDDVDRFLAVLPRVLAEQQA